MRSIRLLFALAILFVAAPTFASGWARAFPELVHSSKLGIARVTDWRLVHCEVQNITSDLMKLGADGRIAWAEILGHSSVKAATAASEGGAFIGGFDYPGVNTKPYGWVARIGADGAVWWARKLTLADESVKFVTMAPTRDGGVAVAGSTRVSSLLLKFDGDGNLQWQKLFDINDIDHIKSISATHDGGLVVAIETVCQSVLLGLAPSGDVKWRGAYTRCTSFNSVMETADGSIVTTGKKIESEVAYAMVMKTDSQGRVACAKGIPIHDGETLSSVTETEARRYLISGSTRTYGAGKESALAISLSSDGSIAWQRAIGGSDEVVYPPAMAARVPGPSQGDAAIVVHMNSAIRVIDLDDGGGTGGCARVAPTVVPWLPIKIEMEASDFPIRKAGLTIDKFTLTAKRAAFTSSAVCAADGEDQQLAAVIAEKVQKVPKQLAPAAVPTTLQAEWQAFQDPIQKLLATKAFDQLDAMADRLRADRSLWQGGTKLEWFYFVVSGRFSTEEERIKRNEILQVWVTARHI